MEDYIRASKIAGPWYFFKWQNPDGTRAPQIGAIYAYLPFYKGIQSV